MSEKKVFCRQRRCIVYKQRKSNSKAGPRPKVPWPTLYFLPNVWAILTTTPWDSMLSMKRREAVRSNSSCFWNWSLFYPVKFFYFSRTAYSKFPGLLLRGASLWAIGRLMASWETEWIRSFKGAACRGFSNSPRSRFMRMLTTRLAQCTKSPIRRIGGMTASLDELLTACHL